MLRLSSLQKRERRNLLVRLTVDPHREMADVDLSNNSWPAKPVKNRFQLFKETLENNALQDAAEEQDGER